jgi:hypothetical protein
MRALACCLISGLLYCPPVPAAETAVEDFATRPGVTQRVLFIKPENPVASVILSAGGHRRLDIFLNGSFGEGAGNCLVRSRAAI